ncbi:hypothetical protein DFH28DRAFT_1120655 [Melampsora americana]|nr:hypothetical protein DFH28DRAFT_1120655 [Melampsora americana]
MSTPTHSVLTADGIDPPLNRQVQPFPNVSPFHSNAHSISSPNPVALFHIKPESPDSTPMARRGRYSLTPVSTAAATTNLSAPSINVTAQPSPAGNPKRPRQNSQPNVPSKWPLRSNSRTSEATQGDSNDNQADVNQADINQALNLFNQGDDQECTDDEDSDHPEKSESQEDDGELDHLPSPQEALGPARQPQRTPLVRGVRHHQIPTHMTGLMLRSFNLLATQGQLDEDHMVIGRLLCPVVEGDDRFIALMVSVLAARQQMTSQVEELTRQLNDLKMVVLNRESAVGRGGLPWEETSELRQCVRSLASQMILNGNIQAYTATQDREGDQDILPYSLYAQVMKGMLANPTEWRNRLLPARYGRDPDPRCAKALRKMIKNILKEVRKEFESLLLTHIQLPNRVNTLSNANVPLLETVIVKLYQKERGLIGGRVRVREEILEDRMQVIHWGLNRDMYENKSFWAVVDQNLERLRRETTRFRYAYFILVLQDDFDRIDGTKTFEQLKTSSDFALPTKERVQQTMGTLMETFGTDVQDDEAAHEIPEDGNN